MSGELSSLSKYVFLLAFLAQIIFGVWFFIAPETWVTLTDWPSELASGRVLGAACIALAIGGFFAYRASSWDQVETYVMIQLFWNIFGLLAMLWAYFTMTLPIATWLIVGLLGLFLVLFLFVYMKEK